MCRKEVLATIVLVLALGLVAGCRSSAEQILTMQASGETVQFQPGGIFTIELRSNPTTGLKWQVLEIGDEKVLELVGHKYEEAATSEGIASAARTETWRFRAVGRGSSSLKMVYLRPGEKPVDTFSLQVEVQ